MAGYRIPGRYLPPRRYRYPYRGRRASGTEKIIGLALGAVLAAGLGKTAVTVTHHHAGTSQHANTMATGPAPAGGTLDCRQLEALWESAGGSPGAAFMAAEIATAESSGQQYSTDWDANGTVDRGYWQVNSIWGPLSTFDPYGNARAAVIISGDGTNWEPWVTFQIGAYQGKC